MLKTVFIICSLAVALLSALPGFSANHTETDFTAICYHNVKKITQCDLDPDQYAISPENLLAHFEWLKAHNYHPVSLDDIIAANAGKKRLPEKPVLLTFDDGYLSFYTEIYPLLKLYNYPAVFAIVGSWLETPDNKKVQYGNKQIPRKHFLSWRQLREMQDSGLVEMASHSFNLHRV